MTNTCCSVLIAILMASGACLAQSQPQVATITGEIREPALREIAFSYQPPSALGSSEQRVVLDSLNHFTLTLPVTRGTPVRGHYGGGQRGWKWVRWIGSPLFGRPSPLVLFVEPGDSLHVAIDPGYFSPSFRFSGPNADNSRFFAEWLPRLLSFRLDYEDLKVEDFSRQVDQWRRDQFAFLAEGREKYALSPGFIDYATAYFNYEWAKLMISYPREYNYANGHQNRAIAPEYYDFLQEIPLVDEKAMRAPPYLIFLERTLGWELNEASRPSRRPSGAIGRPPRDRAGSWTRCPDHLGLGCPRCPKKYTCRVWRCRRGPRPNSTPCTKRTADGPGCRKWSICQRLVCCKRPRPNSTPSTNIVNRSGCPRRLIYRAWVYRRSPRPNSIRYMLKDAGQSGIFREDTIWLKKNWRGECSTGIWPER